MKTALVTIAIGKKYEDMFERYAAARFRAYADRCGYDAKIITKPIRDLPGKKFTWQKMLLFELPWFRDYDQIIALDSDILIAHDAPPFPEVPAGKIVAALDKGPFEVNSGVMVFRPGPEVEAVLQET